MSKANDATSRLHRISDQNLLTKKKILKYNVFCRFFLDTIPSVCSTHALILCFMLLLVVFYTPFLCLSFSHTHILYLSYMYISFITDFDIQ